MIINSGIKSLGSFLKDSRYHVPNYQRNYTWTKDNWEDLWLDLMNIYESDQLKSHFFGQMVLHTDDTNKKKFIIDGQQRLTTSIILLDAFRKSFKEMYERDKLDARFEVEDLTNMFIGRMSDKRYEPRLILNEKIQAFFIEHIQKENEIVLKSEEISRLKQSEKLIYEASLYFMKKINSFNHQYKNLNIQYHELSNLLTTLLNKFNFLMIETGKMEEAFIIFETLNARGKELTVSDLLKNHVFRTAKEQIEDIKISWDWMIVNLDGINPSKFIRHYWNTLYCYIREKDLYLKMRKKYDTQRKVNKLMYDLVRLSELYRSLVYPDRHTYFKNTYLIETNREVNQLRNKSYYPIIMALVLQGTSEDEIHLVYKIIEKVIVRNCTISGKVNSYLEKSFADIAQHIMNQSLKNTDEVIMVLRSLMIADEEFFQNFKIFEIKNPQIIRYLLKKIHNHSSDEIRILDDNKEVHIEHILPKTPRNKKLNLLARNDHERLINRFGNLTLLGQEFNLKAQNKAFNEKKMIYEQSEIPLTKDLLKYETWSTKEINQRQEELAQLALKIW